MKLIDDNEAHIEPELFLNQFVEDTTSFFNRANG